MKRKPLNPWPVVIAAFCIVAFAAAAVIVVVMLNQRVELVRPDYYAQDQRHEERMQEERRARMNPVAVTYDAADGRIALTFTSRDVAGTVMLFRPSDLTLDRRYAVAVDSSGQQMINTDGLAPGLWRIRLEWVQDGLAHYQEELVTLP